VAEANFRDIQKALRELGLEPDSRVVAHVSLAAIGPVRGGAEMLAGALSSLCQLVLMPAFTPQCQVWPLLGPPGNGAAYAGHEAENAQAEIFRPELASPLATGAVAEALRRLPGARRSMHPLYSFVAVGQGAEVALSAQNLAEPLGPIAHLAESDRGADVLLIGLDHTANTAIHYAEARAGRKQFVRWALAPRGAIECLACPGCPDGFNTLLPHISTHTRISQVGMARVERIPLGALVRVVVGLIGRDPSALLCREPGCLRCSDVRAAAATLPA
jgi:aminoglycoside 3-N-acetyltransferase